MLQSRCPIIQPIGRSRITPPIVLVLLSCLSLWTICDSVGAKEEATEIRCITEWGAAGKSAPTFHTIPTAQINDGYCDCIYTALDEPNTSACSGVGYWAGLPLDDDAKKAPLPPVTFQCPKQPKLRLPMSRVQDGVCDCCDGADEAAGTQCPDDCAAVLLAMEQERALLVKRYTEGSKQRATMISKYQAYVQEMKTKLKQFNHDLQQKQTQLTKHQRDYKVARKQYTVRHIERVIHEMNALLGHDRSGAAAVLHFLNDFSIAELEQLIVNACQMVGEMVSDTQSSPFRPYWGDRATCVPLRLAALEMGDMWEMNEEQQSLELRRLSLLDENDALILLLADMYFYNTQIDNSSSTLPVWNEADWKQLKNAGTVKKPLAARRHSRDEDDYEIDDYEEEYNIEEDSASDSTDSVSNLLDGTAEGRELIRPAVEYSSFSEPRRQFIRRVNELLPVFTEWIQEIERTLEDETDDGDESSSDALNSLPAIRALLETRVAAIQHGYETAVSAHILLKLITVESLIFLEDEFVDKTKDSKNEISLFHTRYLQKLLIGTIYHSRISAVQFYELFMATLGNQEGGYIEPESSEQPTCPLPWAHLCPSQSSLEHSNKTISIPSSIVEAVDSFCSQLPEDASRTDTCGATTDIPPTSISDGYLGYYPIAPCGEEDRLNALFHKLGHDESVCSDNEKWARKDIATYKETVEQTVTSIGSIEGKISEIQESMGDPNDTEVLKYGADGELYPIRDDCFSITQGKYKYEVCMFQSATQKDVNNGDSGTHLGSWTGSFMETTHASSDDSEHTQRVWKWENGAQCWNGPQRSITAYLTCGVETKVLSADEPDTCRYVLEMESPVACDDSFKILHGL